jgi:hypothetical protein
MAVSGSTARRLERYEPDQMQHPPKLNPAFSGALRTFAYWVANGSLAHPLLEGVDYRPVMLNEPSLMEQAFAIFVNVIELDDEGKPVNAKYAEYRAAQWIRCYCDRTYEVTPPFAGSEVALHGPAPKVDPKPWPSADG